MTSDNSLLELSDLVTAVCGTVVGAVPKNVVFTSVTTDSRQCKKNSLFVPLMGTVQNGHVYIEQALKNGASIFFAQKNQVTKDLSHYESLAKEFGAVCIAVDNTLYALQNAAARYVAKFSNLIKIGITGSSGKTTTKEILGSVLSQKYNVVMNEGNLNSETGLPLSVFKIRSEHEVAIFEMGMNRRGEISELAKVLLPSIAVITNIGTAHIGILGTQEAIAEEKKSIFENFSENCVGFVNESDKYAPYLCNVAKGTVYTFGTKSNKRITDVSSSGLDGTVFDYAGSFVRFPVPGKHNFCNALASIAVAEYLHLTCQEIKLGLESVKTIFGRSQVYKGFVTLVHDCYNANPDSMQSALSFCDDLEWHNKKIYVVGDMLELGDKSKIEHIKIGKIIAKSKADVALFFGDEMKAAYDVCKDAKRAFWSNNIEDIINQLEVSSCSGDLVMLKASKGMALWRAARAVQIELGEEA